MNGTNDIMRALDAFVRKYYKSRLIRGSLWTVGLLVGLFLLAVLIEHFGWLPSVGRGLLFWGGLVVAVVAISLLVIRPLLKMYGLSKKRLSHAEAARIIGKHFPEVSDRLLNLLQLMEDTPQSESDLLVASIEQRTAQLRPVPMLKAINLKDNLKYLKYALPPVLVLLALLLFAPRVVQEPTRRIVNYQTAFERPAPFSFVILNNTLQTMQGEDFELLATTRGDARPSEVRLVMDGRSARMVAERDTFRFTIRHPNRSALFHLEGGGVQSTEYELQVLPHPAVLNFSMQLNYPAYTHRPSETLVGVGDASMPEGTTVRWLFQTRDADCLSWQVDSLGWHTEKVGEGGRLQWQRKIMHTEGYAFCVTRGEHSSDTLAYQLTAIPDAAPQIEVEEIADTLHPDRRLFRGTVKDDYGFSRLCFCHKTTGTDTDSTAEVDIALPDGATVHEFYFTFNTAELALRPGDALEYHFEVSDNDAIHGPKSTRSRQFELRIPTDEELTQQLAQNSLEAQQQGEQSLGELQQLQEEINEMMRKLVDKKELDWQDKRTLEQLTQKQEQVRQQLRQMQQNLQENNRLEQKYREQSQQLMEKQRELDRLMNEVMDEQMRQTMQEIEKLMKQADKQKVQEQLDKLKMDNAELERQLDQNIELMKRLELEKRMEQAIKNIDQLAEQQRKLAEQTANAKRSDKDSLMRQQQQINQQLKELEEEARQISEGYKQLDEELKLPEALMQQVDQESQTAQEKIEQGRNKEASEMQKQAADDMEKLSEAMAEAQVDMQQASLAEDAEMVRMLLKNLVTLSMNQEQLIADVGNTYIQDPLYQQIINRQNRIRDDFHPLQDSLNAMAHRQMQVAAAIGTNVAQANSNIHTALDNLLNMNQTFYGNYRNTQAARPMQYSMTSLNNLALVLAESLDKMQNDMRANAQKKKSGNCKNPGNGNKPSNNPGKGKGKPSAQTIKQMQQELNRQMEALKKQLDQQKGNSPNRHQIGQGQQMSEELARMAAEQEQIRRMMQQYGQELKEASGGDKQLAREIDQLLKQMEQTEQDLVNRTINQQTLRRGQQIMSRLLEHERAELQREREQRRESREGQDLYSQPTPAELEQYLRQLRPAEEPLRTLPPSLAPFYRDKARDYLAQ